MNAKKLLFVVLFAAAVTTSSQPSTGTFPNQQRGPAVSSPQVFMDESNGDRVSHYPPYYHPERSGNH